jgi:hypothetical protein
MHLFIFVMEFHCVAQADLKLVIPLSQFLSAGIMGMYHHTQL